MTVKGSHYDYLNQAWTVDGRYVACGHPVSMDCHCYGKAHAGEPAPIENLPTVVIDQWRAIVDAMNARGLKATLEGGGAACPFICIALCDGRVANFGDVNPNWTGDIYPTREMGEQGEPGVSFELPLSSTVFDAERIAELTIKAIVELETHCRQIFNAA